MSAIVQRPLLQLRAVYKNSGSDGHHWVRRESYRDPQWIASCPVQHLAGRRRKIASVNALQAEHVAHRVKAWLLMFEPSCGAQRTAGERLAALSAMDQFE